MLYIIKSIKLFLFLTFFFIAPTGSASAGGASGKSGSSSMGSRSAAPRGTSLGRVEPRGGTAAAVALGVIVLAGRAGISGDGPRTDAGREAREFLRRRSLGDENIEVLCMGAVCGVMGV